MVSGRPIAELQKLLPVPGMGYAGSYGGEVLLPEDERLLIRVDRPAVTAISRSHQRIKRRLSLAPGTFIEQKPFSIALHYRLASAVEARSVVSDFLRLTAPEVKKKVVSWSWGKSVVELKPRNIGKGKIVLDLLRHYGCRKEETTFIGDDQTDEEAFLALHPNATTILVSKLEKPTNARFRLSSVARVIAFLEHFATNAGG
jgi:trehalose 6-phosphate phosphatase